MTLEMLVGRETALQGARDFTPASFIMRLGPRYGREKIAAATAETGESRNAGRNDGVIRQNGQSQPGGERRRVICIELT